jgi:hypothetical protein
MTLTTVNGDSGVRKQSQNRRTNLDTISQIGIIRKRLDVLSQIYYYNLWDIICYIQKYFISLYYEFQYRKFSTGKQSSPTGKW